MNTTQRSIAVPAAVFALLAAGCAPKALYFGTNTSLGLDVSGTTSVPNHASLAYQRTEVAIVPRTASGTEVSVIGKIDSDIQFFGGQRLKQVFATGEAARNVAASGNALRTARATPETAGRTTEAEPPSDESLVFTTHNTLGFDISYGTASVAPQLLLGFKRGEATVIPMRKSDTEVRSVYGDISINTQDKATSDTVAAATGSGASSGLAAPLPTLVKGTRIVQTFATGEAAKIYTGDEQTAQQVRQAIGLAVINSHTVHALAALREIYRRATPAQQERFRAVIADHGYEGKNNQGKFFADATIAPAKLAEVDDALRAETTLQPLFDQ